MTCPILKPMIGVLLRHQRDFAVFQVEDETWAAWSHLADREESISQDHARNRACAALSFMCSHVSHGRGHIAGHIIHENAELRAALDVIGHQRRCDVYALERLLGAARPFDREHVLHHGEQELEGTSSPLRAAAELTLAQRVKCVGTVAAQLLAPQVSDTAGQAVGDYLVSGGSIDITTRAIELISEVER